MSDIKARIRHNSKTAEHSPKFKLKQNSVKKKLRTTKNTTTFLDTHYSISLREKYLKQGPLTIEQKRFLNMVSDSRVVIKSNTSGFT